MAHAGALSLLSVLATLIGRLARDERTRGEGIGGLLLADAVWRVIGAIRSLAAFAIAVDAIDKGSSFLSQLWIRAVSKPTTQTFYAGIRSGRVPARCLDSYRCPAFRAVQFAFKPVPVELIDEKGGSLGGRLGKRQKRKGRKKLERISAGLNRDFPIPCNVLMSESVGIDSIYGADRCRSHVLWSYASG
jgi:hypothetical protein